ncbi:hypothetical protein Tco_0826226 [Tanacetum coccineum]
MPKKMKDPRLFTLTCRLGNSESFDTLADLGSCANLIPLYLFKKLTIGLLEETGHVIGLADGTKSYPVGIIKKCRSSHRKVKTLRILLCAQTPFYARKDFLDHYLPGEWELARDVELNPFKDIIVFRKMVEFLGTTPINLKENLDIAQEKETFNPLEIGIDLFSYESHACLEFEQISRSYGTPTPQDKIAKPISFSPDRRGLVKIWHVCKPINVTYDDGSGEYYGMRPTCDLDSKFYFGYKEVFGVNEQGYVMDNKISMIQHGNMGIMNGFGHNNLHESDRELIFNEWILDSYNVEEEYAKEIGDPYSRIFDEYNRVFNNEIKHLTNEYILRIGKRGYILDDVWEKCQQNYKKINKAWHDEAYKEDEMWRIGDEKTDYDPPYVHVKTFEVKKYSFKGGRSFICITDREDEALPLGRVNGARFKAMIRKEL